MILELLFGLITGLINLIPFELPSLPDRVLTTLDFIFDGILGSLGLLNMFFDLKFWISCTVIMLTIYNIKHIWNTFVYIINLIPGFEISYWK